MNNYECPLVSVCIPTYNGQRFIADALESAISQTYSNLEIIISDDNSNDNTLEVIKFIKDKTEIPISLYNHEPKGIGANWNNCITKANGEYIKFLFQDDILEPHCVETMMYMAIQYPEAGLLYCKREFIVESLTEEFKDFVVNYKDLHLNWESFKPTQGVLSGHIYLKDRQFLNTPKNKIGEPTNVLLKRVCFDKVGYFSGEMIQNLDCEFWYRIMKYYSIGFIDDYLVKFRLHENQASALNKKAHFSDKNLLYLHYYKDLFWCLHLKNKLKLLKLFHPLFKVLVRIKQKVQSIL